MKALRLFKTVLTPCAFVLITLCQTPAKTVGMAFRPLKAADHVGDIDMPVPGHVIGRHRRTIFIGFDLGRAVGLGSVHDFIIRCHRESIPRFVPSTVKRMHKESRAARSSGLGINPETNGRISHSKPIGKSPDGIIRYTSPTVFLDGRDGFRRSAHWQTETRFESGIPP